MESHISKNGAGTVSLSVLFHIQPKKKKSIVLITKKKKKSCITEDEGENGDTQVGTL